MVVAPKEVNAYFVLLLVHTSQTLRSDLTLPCKLTGPKESLQFNLNSISYLKVNQVKVKIDFEEKLKLN